MAEVEQEQEEGLTESYADDEAYDESYLDLNLEEAVDLVAVDPDEYGLVILDAKIGRKSPQHQKYLMVRFDIPEVSNAKDFNHIMMIPDPAFDKDDKQFNKRKLAIRELFKACGLDYSGRIDVNALKGAECYAILGKEDDPEYGEQNRVRRFIIPA